METNKKASPVADYIRAKMNDSSIYCLKNEPRLSAATFQSLLDNGIRTTSNTSGIGSQFDVPSGNAFHNK